MQGDQWVWLKTDSQKKNNVRDKDSKLQRNLDCFETLHPVGSREPETLVSYCNDQRYSY